MMKTLLSFVLSIAVFSVMADYTCTTNGYTFHYTLSDGKATIVKGGERSYKGTLLIPSVLDGYPVETISYDAFMHFTNLPHMVVSEGIRQIDHCVLSNSMRPG